MFMENELASYQDEVIGQLQGCLDDAKQLTSNLTRELTLQAASYNEDCLRWHRRELELTSGRGRPSSTSYERP